MSVAVIIPFRDRGTDPLRAANLARVLEHWAGFNTDLIIASDGLEGSASFNRHKAYNKAATQTDANILAFVESDMLLDFSVMDQAIDMAGASPGLVVPFTERHELSAQDSAKVRAHKVDYHHVRGEVIKPKPRRTGAINVLSRATLNAVGQYDPTFSGCWWDDRSMHIAFDMCAGLTRWIDGPSWHLYHLPGYTGEHLTPEDIAATQRNRERWQLYTQAHTPDHIRNLTASP